MSNQEDRRGYNKEWVITLALAAAGAVFGAGAMKATGEAATKSNDRDHEMLLVHETRISKVEQLVNDTNEGVKELLDRVPKP